MGRLCFRDPFGSLKFIFLPAHLSASRFGVATSLDIKGLIASGEAERYELHASHLNEQMVHVLKTIGFDKRYQREQYVDIYIYFVQRVTLIALVETNGLEHMDHLLIEMARMELVALGLPLGDEPFDVRTHSPPQSGTLTNAPAKKSNRCDPNGSRKQSRPTEAPRPQHSQHTSCRSRRDSMPYTQFCWIVAAMSIRGRKPPYFQPSHFSRKRLDLVSTDFWLLLISPFVTKALNARDPPSPCPLKRSAP